MHDNHSDTSTPTSTESDLVIESVTHSYGRDVVVHDATLRTAPGKFHCLLGPSGSGKTTLLRLVAGLERLQKGRIVIPPGQIATPAQHIPPEERTVGFVFQDYALFPHLNVRENVTFGVRNHTRLARIERARLLLARVGMLEFEKAMPHTLSGGQQQRVALARALGRDPRVMLLDEPFSGLDARLRGEVRGATIDLLKSSGVATLMVTHDPHEAMMVADTISIIHRGHIEQSGTPQELYSQPINERVATSLGEVNCFHGEIANSQLSTPFGLIDADAPSFVEGDRATAILRPQAITIVSESSPLSVRAVVVSARYLGESVRVEAVLPCGQRVIAIAPSNCTVHSEQTIYLSRTAAGADYQIVPSLETPLEDC